MLGKVNFQGLKTTSEFILRTIGQSKSIFRIFHVKIWLIYANIQSKKVNKCTFFLTKQVNVLLKQVYLAIYAIEISIETPRFNLKEISMKITYFYMVLFTRRSQGCSNYDGRPHFCPTVCKNGNIDFFHYFPPTYTCPIVSFNC